MSAAAHESNHESDPTEIEIIDRIILDSSGNFVAQTCVEVCSITHNLRKHNEYRITQVFRTKRNLLSHNNSHGHIQRRGDRYRAEHAKKHGRVEKNWASDGIGNGDDETVEETNVDLNVEFNGVENPRQRVHPNDGGKPSKTAPVNRSTLATTAHIFTILMFVGFVCWHKALLDSLPDKPTNQVSAELLKKLYGDFVKRRANGNATFNEETPIEEDTSSSNINHCIMPEERVEFNDFQLLLTDDFVKEWGTCIGVVVSVVFSIAVITILRCRNRAIEAERRVEEEKKRRLDAEETNKMLHDPDRDSRAIKNFDAYEAHISRCKARSSIL